MKIKSLVALTILLLLLTGTAVAQQRDRRADFDVQCANNLTVSSTGRLWIATRCGEVYMADSVGASWHTMIGFGNIHSFDRVAAFGDQTALLAGFISIENYEENRYRPLYNKALRSTTGGAVWDTVTFGIGTHWIRGHFYTDDGHLWMGSSQSQDPGYLFYSADSGRTFATLRTGFDTDVKIEEIFMVSPDSGFVGTYENQIFTTSDNWRTFSQLPTPRDQGLHDGNRLVRRLRTWRGLLLVCQGDRTFYTPADETLWRPMPLPLADFEIDSESGLLWAVTDSGQLVLMDDTAHWQVMDEKPQIPYKKIDCVQKGRVFFLTDAGVVCITSDGRADTCGFFTEERTLEEYFDETVEEWDEASRSNVLPTISHGGRLWRSDRRSIYLKDPQGWYRIARPLHVVSLLPDRDRDDRVIIMRGDGKNYSVDTAGVVEPYLYRQPLGRFVKSGLKSLTIETYYGGCFHFEPDCIRYERKGNNLVQTNYSVKINRCPKRVMPVDSLEQALLRLGGCYSLFPTPLDFGLQEHDADLEATYLSRNDWCTSYSGYRITFINCDGDTLLALGSSDQECGERFPWLLPMTLQWREASICTFQPLLWQTLLPLLPEDMKLREQLDNSTLIELQPGDLLFYKDTQGMGAAVSESTGQYTHVALVAEVGDTVWLIDATQRHGVSRRPFLRHPGGTKPYPDVFRLTVPFDTATVLEHARSFVGQPYDNAFLPDNNALYCSELIQECFRRSDGSPLFESKPMNWRNAKGKLPRYWKRHFRKLGTPVPEGVPGTNPTDLSRSPLLRKL